MNLNPVNKPVTWLFNPFFYLAGGKALGIGLLVILAAGLLGAYSNTHFDGVLDTHTGAHVPLLLFVAEGIIDWLCMAVVLVGLGIICSRKSFRALDVFGTQALARWPTLLLGLLMMPDAIRRFGEQILDWATHPGAKLAINMSDAVVFAIVIIASIPLFFWMIFLMYKSFSVSCNLAGVKGVCTFAAGLIGAEILSKVCLGLLLASVLSEARPASAVVQAPLAARLTQPSAKPPAESSVNL